MVAILALLVGAALGGGAAWLLARARADAALTTLRVQLEHERAGFEEKVALLKHAENELTDSFRAMSAQALQLNNTAFLDLARTQLEKFQETAQGDLAQRQKAVEAIVSPIRESLEKVDGQIRNLEQARTHAYGTLSEQVRALAEGQRELRTETGNLVSALRAPDRARPLGRDAAQARRRDGGDARVLRLRRAVDARATTTGCCGRT